MEIKLTYNKIYDIADLYNKHIKENMEIYLPAKLNFAIHKNFKQIIQLKEEIEETRKNVILHYGVENSEGNYSIKDGYLEIAQKELDELAKTVETLNIVPFSLDELGDLKFTPGQFEALEFMINDSAEADN